MRFLELVNVLRVVYRLSTPLAFILSLAGFVLCGTFTCKPRSWSSTPDHASEEAFSRRVADALPIPRLRFDLHDLAKHGRFRIEHDASLGHDDALPGAHYAPSEPNLHRVNELAHIGSEFGSDLPASESKETTSLKSKGFPVYGRGDTTGASSTLTLYDLALARFNRTSCLPPGRKLSSFNKFVASGECALILSVLSSPGAENIESKQIPRRWIEVWFGEERLPQEWVPPQEEVGLSAIGKLRTLVTTEIARLERYS